VRFEPGDDKRVRLVEVAGARPLHGHNRHTDGGAREAALARLAEWERLR
jgi:urease beta subunit